MSAPTVGPQGGFRVAVRHVPAAPVISLRCLIRGGSRSESTPGQALLTGRMLGEGTERRDYRKLAEDLEGRGMLLSSYGTAEVHGIGLDALADDWEVALETLSELIYQPSFDAERFAFVRTQALAELEALGDQPEVRTGWKFAEQLYAPHPRGRRLLGDANSLKALSPADCRTFHRAALDRRGVLAMAGEIDEGQVVAKLESLIGACDDSAGPVGDETPPSPDADNPRHQTIRTGTAVEQAVVFSGHLTVPRSDPDYAAMEIVSVVLGAGSGLAGRIPTRIREQEGLAYSAQAQAVAGAGLDPGHLVAFVGTAPESAERAAELVAEEVRGLVENGLTGAELEAARSYLLGRDPFRRETARQWAELLAEDEFYGVPLADAQARRRELEAPDQETVETAIRRHLDADRLTTTIGLPGALAKPG